MIPMSMRSTAGSSSASTARPTRRPHRTVPAAAALLFLIGFLASAACGPTPGAATDDRLTVIAGFYPLEFLAERVGGDRVRVSNLVKPGAEPHDLELSPRQVAVVGEADLVLRLGGFQPALDDALSQTTDRAVLDVATVEPLHDGFVPLEEGELAEDERGKDPHVWLDPVRFAAIADAVAARLSALDRDHAAAYRSRAVALRRDLETLDQEYASGLRTCRSRTIVVSHNAFGYLAQRYRLVQVPITGLTPEEEPSPGRLAEVAAFARKHGVTVIFFETLVSPRIAKTLAAEVGARAEVLDPIEGLPPGSTADYPAVMRSNLATLRSALGCT